MSVTLEWIQSWYSTQCDGDWEENYGVQIQTLANPGWRVHIDLVGTSLEDSPFEEVVTERTEQNWVHCRVRDSAFEGRSGPSNLTEILHIFKDWTEQHQPS